MQTRKLKNGRRLAPAVTALAMVGAMGVGFTQLGGASALTPNGGGKCGGGPTQTLTLEQAARAGVYLGKPKHKTKTVTVTRTKTVTKTVTRWKTVHKCHTVTVTDTYTTSTLAPL
ncbi:hypothetical protein [Nocardioides caldifontis]|uniref:hypothetical protein n=1 Tax=Nocardioides caldifontis TaxID=2588938 RepID=UPI0011E0054F|nr:hypothetical protein [Nocardioides caldifontis]